MENFYREEADRKSADGWSSVMGSAAAKGREALATKLLSVSGEHAMSTDTVLKILEKAPAPTASGTEQPVQHQETYPIIASFGYPSAPGGIFDARLMELGRQSAMELLGKRD